jgi:hypothetical protein
VYGRDGLPLVLPIDADLDDLRAEVNLAGRYRLDLVDQNNKAIEGAPSGYVQINLDAPPVANTNSTGGVGLPSKPSDNIVIEAMRTQSAMAMAVIERFPQMMEAAATLLRAADGAGLPAREPRTSEDVDEESDDTAAPQPGFDLSAIVAQVVPMLLMGLGNGKAKLPGLGELLDWRKAAPTAKSRPNDSAKSAKAAEAAEAIAASVPDNANDVLPPIDPQTMAHFVAVQSALTPEESAIAREVAKELSAADLRAWFDELSTLSVPDAVTKVRKLISGLGKTGGAS